MPRPTGGEAFQADGLTVTPIPTFEGPSSEPDNHSFLFEFAGRKILHLGDCQGLMTALGEAESDSSAREAMEGRTDGLGRYYLTLPLPRPDWILEGRLSQGEVLVVGLTPGPPGPS